ncbi:MAG: TonB-dependent receptor [Tannerellaceae bacterium]|jgi:TonB-linked SusC/RagA family outer membrane protein|nr:TonB-dependent receptor [Tannerellaceae bacterium]
MKKVLRWLLVKKIWLCFIVFSPLFLQAQNLTVTGQVVDDVGEALIGAAIQIKGSTEGVITDVDGKFSINVSSGKTLVVSYLGYQSVEQVVRNSSPLNFKLSPDNVELQEVVAVAYGVQKKATLTGAITSVGSDDLLKASTPSLGNALAGRLPGLSTIQYTGVPGADDPNIFIRGVGSLNSSNPLILVDGVERSFTQIDPNEVENISILKDASATAVFGVRGANGVILITTKRGEAGKTKISASTSFGAQSPTRFVDFVESYEYATFYNRVQELDGMAKDQWKYSDEAVQHFKDKDMPLLYPSINWADYIMKDAALQSQHNVSLSGGNDRARFFTSVGLLDQDGLFNTFATDKNANFNYNRLNYRANLDLTINKISSLALNIGGRMQTRTYIGNGDQDILSYIQQGNPMSGAGVVDGKYIVGNPTYVGVFDMDGIESYYGSGYKKETTNVLNLDLAYKLNLDAITQGLSFNIKGAYNSSYTKRKSRTTWDPVKFLPRLAADGKTVVLERSGEYRPFDYSEDSWFSRDWYAEASLSYARKFGLHDVSALVLYNESKTYYPNSYSEIPSGYVGLVARATYNYASRYLLDMNVGYNGSENFAPGRRYGLFPSASLGWIMSEEAFMKDQNVINYLKFRYSYGLVGNDRMGGSRFLYLPGTWGIINGLGDAWNYERTQGYNFGTNSNTFRNIAKELTSGNPLVTWETAAKQNIGLDIRTLNNRLGINVDVFFEDRKDILVNNGSMLPSYTSMKATSVNMGRVENRGYEIVLNWTDKIGNFQYSISPSVTFARNKIIEMAEVKKNHDWLYGTGHPVGQPFGKVFYAFYEGQETEERYKKDFGVDYFPRQIAGELRPGDCVYVDLDEDGMIGPDDNQVIGYTDNPEYTFTLNTNFSYKRFDFSMLWTGATHVSRMLGGPFREQFGIKNNSALSRWVYENSWWPETADKAILPRVTFVNLNNNTQDSKIWQVDASYARLKSIEFGYTFKISKIKALQSARVYLNGLNLVTISPFQGNDPESKGGTWQNGIRYPLTKTFSAGLQVNF